MCTAPIVSDRPQRILFLWWGRRGAMSRFMLDVYEAARHSSELEPLLSVSRSTALIAQFRSCEAPLLEVETFTRGWGAFAAWRIPRLRRSLSGFLAEQRVDAVVVLMSHVWTPLVAPAVTRSRVPYVVVAHDAASHPGDRSGRVLDWLKRDFNFADRIIALSQSVADALMGTGKIPAERLNVLFHPDFRSEGSAKPSGGKRLRALFLGRIMAYKGLPLFVDALEQLRGRGIEVDASIVGEGNLKPHLERLLRCGVAIRNAWLSDNEIDEVLAAHDIVVLTHVEASQSGVAALALGAGLPVVATPVGGLREQVEHEVTGLLTERVDASAVADALQRLVREPGLLSRLRTGVAATSSKRSMQGFVREIAALCADLRRRQVCPHA